MPEIKMNLNFEIDVLTAGTAAQLVNAIFELLLYQRNQIPLNYKTFRHYVNTWNAANEELTNATDNIQNFHLDLQRDQAKKTKTAISAMSELIRNSFEQHAIKCIRFLLGSTAFTAREAYTIHIPTVQRSHSHHQHRMPLAYLNQTLLNFLTSETLYGIFSNNLTPTNIYLELELLNNATELTTADLMSKSSGRLPFSCKDIHIHLLPQTAGNCDASQLKCCRNLQIFDDFQAMHLNDVEEKAEQLHAKDKATAKLEENVAQPENEQTCWWEADLVIRGFKDKLVQGKTIWKK